jgi:O-antigen/teichoic acid export membrane protein
MRLDNPALAKRILSNISFSLLDQVLFKTGTTLAFVLLVRLLPASGITAVGVGMGYLVFIAYLDIGLNQILLRDYPNFKSDANRRNEHFTAYLVFFWLQAGAIFLLCLALMLFALSDLDVPGLSFLFLGMTIDVIVLSYQDWVKGIFHVDLRQGLATSISFALTCIRLASYGVLLFSPTLDTYTWILIANACVGGIMWSVALWRSVQFRLAFTIRIPGIIKHSLKDYAIWNHLNRTAADTLFTVDTVILTLFGLLHEVGAYAVALKTTSLLFLVPWQLLRGLQVTLSNYTDSRRRTEAINTFMKVNSMISIAQLAFIFFAGNWFLQLLFGPNISPDAVRFTIIIAVAVTIMNLGWPLVGIINNLCILRVAFFRVFLPVLVFGISIYIGTAWLWGAIGMAYGNIAVYALLLFALIIFVRQNYPWTFRIQPITQEERRLLRELMGGFH